MNQPLKVKRMLPNAVLPKRASVGAAAMDLSAALDASVVIGPGKTAIIPTGIAIELPRADLVALVFSRSGHGFNHGVGLANSVGVIDSDYRGAISVAMINHSDKPFTVNPGDRIAQLMITHALPLPVEEVDDLGDTARGAGGFGSTGVG